jgi:hypothetical protein
MKMKPLMKVRSVIASAKRFVASRPPSGHEPHEDMNSPSSEVVPPSHFSDLLHFARQNGLPYETRHGWCHGSELSAYRQNGFTLANSSYALVAAAIAASVRAFSRPARSPAAKMRLGFDPGRIPIAVRRRSSTAMSLSSPRLSYNCSSA